MMKSINPVRNLKATWKVGILSMMDEFENQIIHAIKKIRDLRQRPDADRIFSTITKDAATNISLADVQKRID